MTDSVGATPPAPLGLMTRIIGVITSPKATFQNVVAAPRPAAVLFIAAVIALASVAPQFTDAGGRPCWTCRSGGGSMVASTTVLR
jgi:hypothetical protein